MKIVIIFPYNKYHLYFQHKLLTAIHKHYPIEEWEKFAKENPTVLPVSCLHI